MQRTIWPGETKQGGTLCGAAKQNITEDYKTLRYITKHCVFKGQARGGFLVLVALRRDFRCFLGLFPDRSLAGGRPWVPSVTPILVLYKQRLGNSHNCNLHVHHPRQLRRHCLMFFSSRQIIMMFLHTKILDIAHSNSVIYVQKVKRLTWPMLIRNSRQWYSAQWRGLKND